MFFKNRSFEDTVKILVDEPHLLKHPQWGPQYKWICDENNNLLIDNVIRYETLQRDFVKMFKVNTSEREFDDYRKYYTNTETIEKVAQKFKITIDLFNYTFDDPESNPSIN